MIAKAGPLLEVSGLKTYYETPRGVVRALDGISLHCEGGETLGLVGETGCGKSTVGLAVIRCVRSPGRIVSGKILFDGTDLLQQPEKYMRKIRGSQISMIFQDPTASLDPMYTIGYQIKESILVHRKTERADSSRITRELLEMVGIPSSLKRSDSYPHEFSGGMRQRVMIAVALACNPKLLIADEPTSNLDVTISAQILDLITRLQNELGMAMIMITHNMGIVAQMCNRVCVLYAGQVVESARVEEIFEKALHPYTKGLLAAIPTLSKKKRLNPIGGTMADRINPPQGCRFHPRCVHATDICEKEEPAYEEVASQHQVACHHWKRIN